MNRVNGARAKYPSNGKSKEFTMRPDAGDGPSARARRLSFYCRSTPRRPAMICFMRRRTRFCPDLCRARRSAAPRRGYSRSRLLDGVPQRGRHCLHECRVMHPTPGKHKAMPDGMIQASVADKDLPVCDSDGWPQQRTDASLAAAFVGSAAAYPCTGTPSVYARPPARRS